MVRVAEDHCPTALSAAKSIEVNFKKLFTLFGEYHKIYDGSSISDSEIALLGKIVQQCTANDIKIDFLLTVSKIKDFMKFYREAFSWATVLPKMHI